MSVASEITRIQNAKANLKTSINAKTDSEHQITDETIDEYADFVDSITSGSGGLDWSAIGYSSTPSPIIVGYNYSILVKNNWVPQQDLTRKLQDDINLIYMPLVDLSITTNAERMFSGCINLQSIPLLDTSNVENMYAMFYNCTSLTSISQIDTSNATNLGWLFGECVSLTTIPQIDTSKATSIKNMFYNCKSLQSLDVSGYDTSRVREFTAMFQGCENLNEITFGSNFKTTSSNTGLVSMFRECKNLKRLDLSSFTRAMGVSSMFYGCEKLEEVNISRLDTSTEAYFDNMFRECKSLEIIDLSVLTGSTYSLQSLSYMFADCTNLREINLSNLGNGRSYAYMNIKGMFQNCTSLEKIDIRSFYFAPITSSTYYQDAFTGVPNNCLIIVKNATQRNWFSSKWPNLTNVKIPSEL